MEPKEIKAEAIPVEDAKKLSELDDKLNSLDSNERLEALAEIYGWEIAIEELNNMYFMGD